MKNKMDGLVTSDSTIPIILSVFVVLATVVVWMWWSSEDEERKKRAAKKSVKAGSILEELTERERQRRRKLEEEVEQIKQIKLRKQAEIEELARLKNEEQVKVRALQEEDQKVADRKKQEEEEKKKAVKDAIAAAHKLGVLCSFKTASLDEQDGGPEFELRIKLTDSVGFPTRVHHIKSRLRSDYPGQPAEHRLRILHHGELVGDSTKLVDIFTAHEPKTSAVQFHLVVADKKQEPVEAPKEVEIKPEPKPERKKRELLSTDPIRVTIRTGSTTEDSTVLNLQLGSTIKEVKTAFVSSSSSSVPYKDDASLRIVFGGRVLKEEETLMALVANGMDKKNLILHAVTDA